MPTDLPRGFRVVQGGGLDPVTKAKRDALEAFTENLRRDDLLGQNASVRPPVGGLRLRRTVIAGTYCENDYCVYEDGQCIGRMYETHAPGGSRCWRWFVQVGRVANGSAGTLDDAKAAFREAWGQR